MKKLTYIILICMLTFISTQAYKLSDPFSMFLPVLCIGVLMLFFTKNKK